MPYHDGSATGLAFDNTWEVADKKMSPSLTNIIREKNDDYGEKHSTYRREEDKSVLWHLPHQGVLLMNAALTVEKGAPNSMYPMWHRFTKEVITNINKLDDIVWIMWGKFAQGFEPLITNPTHRILKSYHPSPLSANQKNADFFGSKPFSKTNEFLKSKNKEVIIW